jgi:hypothetical protein
MPSHSRRPTGTPGRARPARPARRARPARPARRARQAWRGWRLSRPFWGALLVIAAGAEVLAVSLSLLSPDPPAKVTLAPVGILIAIALVLCALLLWFHPVQRSLYSTAAILLAIGALMTAHLGGYLMGTLLGAIGGSVAFAWVPGEQPELRARHGKAPRPDGPGPALTLIIGDSDVDLAPPETSWGDEEPGTGTSPWRPAAVGFPPDSGGPPLS